MWDPQVRFCERPGGAIPRAYSTCRSGRAERGVLGKKNLGVQGAEPPARVDFFQERI